jgi:dTDP-glucose 4,6-dehydratase
MSKRLLLTGAGGFIGSHVLEHVLTNTDWEVVCVCSWRHKGTPERILEVLKGDTMRPLLERAKDAIRETPTWADRVTVITHDLAAPFTAHTKARIGSIDYAINAAAESHVDRSIEDPVPFVQNNVNVALTMLEWAREAKPEVFVQVSTDEVYGAAPEGHNHAEWEAILPSNPYSASKACQEAIAISYWRTYGVPVVITNTMNNFGEMQDAEKYMAKCVRLIAAGETVPVHGRDGKYGSRYYLHARNHADAILHIITNLRPKMFGEADRPDRYNVVGDAEKNNLEVAQDIAAAVHPDGAWAKSFSFIEIDFHSTRPGHDPRYALDGAKLKATGWVPPLDYATSLKRYVDWTLAHPEWR